MSSTRRRAGTVAAWTLAATVAFGAVAGAVGSVALAGPTPAPDRSASPSATGDPSPKPYVTTSPGVGEKGEKGGRRGAAAHALRKRGLHGELVVKGADGAYVTVLTQRGAVAAVDADSVTLKSEDGYTREYAVTPDTKLRKDGAAAEIADLEVGDQAAVVAVKSGDTATARRIHVGEK